MTLSLCMIVRNEEQVLARCLDSVMGCFDEIIILDTGSTDNTCQIASEYTPHLYHATWNDDFASMRNMSFSYATSDYIMWLDADDILSEENKEKLLRLKKTFTGETDVYHMYYATAFDEEDRPTFYFTRERIVRRGARHHWHGCVHETLICNGTSRQSNIFVFHKSIKKQYSNRNLLIFENKIKADNALEPRELFYYGRELFYNRFYSKAIEILTSFLSCKNAWIENKLDAHIIISKCYEALGHPLLALQTLHRSIELSPPYAELCCEIGRLYIILENYISAAWWYSLALKHPYPNSNGAFINCDYEKYIPCLQLCVIFYKFGEIKKSIEYNEMAAEARPHSRAVQYNRQFFLSLEQKKS